MIRCSALLLIAALAACDAADRVGPRPEAVLPPDADRFGAPDRVVRAGESIQDAVTAAEAGDVIHIEPGLYVESITVNTPGIKLIGMRDRAGAGVVIENPGGARNGIFVGDGADGFALANVTVRGFDRNGVFLVRVDGFLLSRVHTEDNGTYGLFPVRSSNGVIEFSSAFGHADAGIYVGLSSDVSVRRSVAIANVIGIEIENSTNIQVVANEATDNVAGVLVVLLPGFDVNTSSDVLVAGNRVRDNNRENFADEGFAAAVPPGSGILVVGSDRTIVEGNTVTGNDFVGIGVGSTLLLGALADLPPEAFDDIEPNPDGVRVSDNAVTGNGAAPPPLPIPLPGVDLFWDLSGTDNCWSGNVFDSSFPPELPACD